MFAKTLTAAIAVATISGSALFASSAPSQAGYYGYGYQGGYHQPKCYYKKIKVWDYYGWHWEKVQVCE